MNRIKCNGSVSIRTFPFRISNLCEVEMYFKLKVKVFFFSFFWKSDKLSVNNFSPQEIQELLKLDVVPWSKHTKVVGKLQYVYTIFIGDSQTTLIKNLSLIPKTAFCLHTFLYFFSRAIFTSFPKVIRGTTRNSIHFPWDTLSTLCTLWCIFHFFRFFW